MQSLYMSMVMFAEQRFMQTTPVDMIAANTPTRTMPDTPAGKYLETIAAYALLPEGSSGMRTLAARPMIVAPSAMNRIASDAHSAPFLDAEGLFAAKQRV